MRRAVGGFLRYIQHNDHRWVAEKPGGVDGFLRYAAHRDRTMPQGRLFGGRGDVGDRDRRELGRFVTRSVEGRASGRAYYRMIISPQDARGLDLRRVTRSVMAQLERDAGVGGLPPWIAAEHRNTAHPHVHVVMAANRQMNDGRFRALVINRERLARMKISMSREIYRHRGPERELDDRNREVGRSWAAHIRSSGLHRTTGNSPQSRPRTSFRSPAQTLEVLSIRLRQVARRYQRHMERELLGEARRQSNERGWER